MYARVTRIQLHLESIEANIAMAGAIADSVGRLPGSLGMYYLVDRPTGGAEVITLWESEAAMDESEGLAVREWISATSEKIVSIYSYEVVAHTEGTAI